MQFNSYIEHLIKLGNVTHVSQLIVSKKKSSIIRWIFRGHKPHVKVRPVLVRFVDEVGAKS